MYSIFIVLIGALYLLFLCIKEKICSYITDKECGHAIKYANIIMIVTFNNLQQEMLANRFLIGYCKEPFEESNWYDQDKDKMYYVYERLGKYLSDVYGDNYRQKFPLSVSKYESSNKKALEVKRNKKVAIILLFSEIGKLPKSVSNGRLILPISRDEEYFEGHSRLIEKAQENLTNLKSGYYIRYFDDPIKNVSPGFYVYGTLGRSIKPIRVWNSKNDEDIDVDTIYKMSGIFL